MKEPAAHDRALQQGHARDEASGFIAFYRWEVEPQHEQAFRDRWHRTTLIGREMGALGSCLARSSDGQLVAIALWPSQAARAAAFEAMGPQSPWVGARRVEEMRLEVVDDLWLSSPFGQSMTEGDDEQLRPARGG